MSSAVILQWCCWAAAGEKNVELAYLICINSSGDIHKHTDCKPGGQQMLQLARCCWSRSLACCPSIHPSIRSLVHPFGILPLRLPSTGSPNGQHAEQISEYSLISATPPNRVKAGILLLLSILILPPPSSLLLLTFNLLLWTHFHDTLCLYLSIYLSNHSSVEHWVCLWVVLLMDILWCVMRTLQWPSSGCDGSSSRRGKEKRSLPVQ